MTRRSLATFLLFAVLGATVSGVVAAPASTDSGGVFSHSFTAIEGQPLPLERFRGRAMLVVNTASFCGFTHQYAELQALWERYRDRGLIVLGVPSDDFNQEMDDNTAIQEFCEVEFGIDFPMTERVSVRGGGSHPFFAEVRAVLGDSAGPSWNFFKYLIAPDGRIVEAWPSRIAPNDPAILNAIEAVLPAT
jgi:glutathione peroxidase